MPSPDPSPSPSPDLAPLPSHLSSNPAYANQHAQLSTVSALHTHNTQLKAELAKAVQIAQELQGQNGVLQAAWNKSKAEQEELKESYALVRAQAESALASKQTAESECEKLYNLWQEKLEQKQAEFELIQQSMVPARELDLIRLQILQESQQAHSALTDELKNEISKYRTLYHDTHHSLVLLTNDANLKQATYEKDLTELRQRSEKTQGELIQKNRKLQELLQDPTLTDRNKQLERTNQELMIRNKALTIEVAEIQQRVIASNVACEQAKLQASGAVQDKESTIKQSNKQLELSEKTINHLTKELAVATSQIQSLKDESLNLSKVNEHSVQQLELEIQDLRFAKEHLEKRLKEVEQKEADAAVKNRESLEAANERALSLERRLVDSEQKNEYDTREYTAAIKALKDEHACTIRELEHQILLLQEAKNHGQQSLLELELSKNEEIAALKQKQLTLQSEMAVLHTERDGFDARLSDAKSELDGVRTELDTKTREHHELNLEYEQLQNKFRASTEKQHVLEQNFDKVSLEADSMKAELIALGQSLEEERKRYGAEIYQTNQRARSEKTLLLNKLNEVQAAAQEAEVKHVKELNDLKKDKTKYKKLSLSLKQKCGEILREFAQTKRDSSLHADSSRFALGNLQKEKEDAERQRDEYKLRFGAVWPQPLLTSTMVGLAHTHPQVDSHAGGVHPHVELPAPGTHAASSVGLTSGHIDVEAGARAAQKQLSDIKLRGTSGR